MGIVSALQLHLPHWFGKILRVYVGLTGALVLLAAATTSISGFGRLAYSLGEHGQLPRAFGRLHRRTLVSPASVIAAAAISIGLLLCTAFLTRPVTFLASLFSFGVLLAFTAAQLAVVKLRVSQPELRRPFRVPLGIRIRGAVIPLPSVVGALLTAAVFVAAMVTHIGARYGGPAWLLAGLVVYFIVRHGSGAGLLEHVAAVDEQELPPQAEFSKILVPMKLGQIGEEMVATAVKLAQERHASVEALFVIRVPLDLPARRAARGGGGAGGGVARRSGRSRGRAGRRGRRPHHPGAVDRRGDRPGGGAQRHRPDRPRLVRPLAAPVPVLLADGRLRPPARPGRGADRRVPAGRARGGLRMTDGGPALTR